MRRATFVLLLLVVACDGSDDRGEPMSDTDLFDPMNDSMPAHSCMSGGENETDGCETGGAGSTGAPQDTDASVVEDECQQSSDCGNGFCTAAANEPPPSGEATFDRQPFVCEFVCIADLDDARWCSDDASCCNANARCTARGYCIVDN